MYIITNVLKSIQAQNRIELENEKNNSILLNIHWSSINELNSFSYTPLIQHIV